MRVRTLTTLVRAGSRKTAIGYVTVTRGGRLRYDAGRFSVMSGRFPNAVAKQLRAALAVCNPMERDALARSVFFAAGG